MMTKKPTTTEHRCHGNKNLTQNRQHVGYRTLRDPFVYGLIDFRGWVIEWYQSWHHSKRPERTVIIKQEILM